MKRLFSSLFLILIALSSFAGAKYIFFFIGDGMGDNQVLIGEMYRAALDGKPLSRVQTLMTTFPVSGQASTFSASNGITDSAAAGTCLATGQKTNNGMLGMTPDEQPVKTVAEVLKADGWGVGIMTTVAIDHATPAAFYAHVPKRSKYYQIGLQLPESQFDFFGGAGFHYPEGKHDDKKLNLYRNAEEKGYVVAHGFEEAQALQYDAKKMIMVQASDDQGAKHGDNLPYAIDRKKEDLTLTQIVRTAIPFLDKRYEQFFMMVEGGMIDYAGHGNDAATSIGELWDMDEAMQAAYGFYKEHPDETLIVVTADHETGGMALGNSDYTLHLDLLQYQKCSAGVLGDRFKKFYKDNKKPSWAQVKELYRDNLGFWDKVEISADEEKELKSVYKSKGDLAEAGVALLNKKAHVGWTTHSHTAHAVPVFAIGVGAELFSGWHDNTEIAPLILQAAGQ